MRLNKRFIAVLSLGFLTLSACGTDEPKKPETPTVIPENFDEVAEFDEAVDMHTAGQKAFIDYKETGKYEDLTKEQIMEMTGQNSSGSLNISAPAGIPVSFTYQYAENVDHYVLEVSKDEKFESGVLTFEGNKDATSITAYNLEIGEEYYYRVGAVEEGSDPDYSNPRKLETADIAPRNLYVDGMTNCRDLGGRETPKGRIKQGLLYRTAALDDSQSGSIVTAKGKEVLKGLELKTEIELRGGPQGTGGEAKKENVSAYGEGMDINFKYVPFAYQNGKNLLFRNIEPVKKVFDILGDTSNYPVFFHCRIGTDRTGLIALLVNALLGIQLQDIFQDYLFSDFGCIGKVPTVGQANEDSIAEYVEELRAFPGDTLQESVYNFLVTAGVPATKLNNIINFLTEGEETTMTKKSDFATVDQLETDLTVTTVDISKDFNKTTRSPANYVTYAKVGDKVTYNFTASEAFDAHVFANLCSKNTSGKLNTAFKLTVNGTEVTNVCDTSFATSKLGFDSTIECFIPAQLTKNKVSFVAGTNTIVLEAKTTTSIKMSQFALSSMSAPATVSVFA